MASVGPSLPPHLAKRKHSDSTIDPLPKRQRSSSPHPPSPAPRRVIGPAAPPAPLSERPSTSPSPDDNDSDSDSDSDSSGFGPSLPPLPGTISHETERTRQAALADDDAAARDALKRPQREEWMLVPPKQDDLSARADPSKLKNRKFNTGKGAKAPRGKDGESALWTETPEQKRKRLEDEVMGVRRPAQLGGEEKRDRGREEEGRETERRIREWNERNRGTSLYEEHKKATPREKEDDPSARAFDKEKDMGMGVKIGHAQKRELLNKAKDFGSRFEKGSYL